MQCPALTIRTLTLLVHAGLFWCCSCWYWYVTVMPPPPCGGPLTHRAFSSISTTVDIGIDGDDSDGGDCEKDHGVYLNNHAVGGDSITEL